MKDSLSDSPRVSPRKSPAPGAGDPAAPKVRKSLRRSEDGAGDSPERGRVKKSTEGSIKIHYEPYDWESLSVKPVIGVDEVGRGCIAGPVYAAACILKSKEHWEHFRDSKLLSDIRREEIAPLIHASHHVGIGISTVREIEEINILQASLQAMRRAVMNLVNELKLETATILIDGTFRIPRMLRRFEQVTLIKGDMRALPVSAASIVAKVARDQQMREIGMRYPHYDFENNKGYGSAAHYYALDQHGPCRHHRKTFRGVRHHFGFVEDQSEPSPEE